MAIGAVAQGWPETDASRVSAHLAAAVALALALTLMLPTPTAAASNGCSVKNEATGRTSSTLQAAVDAARPRQTLLVRGTCHGKTVIRKSLVIRGGTTVRWGKTVLDGGGRTRVLTVSRKARVSLQRLTVRHGHDSSRRSPEHIGRGGGIINRGRLVLRDVIVRKNRALQGSGIYSTGELFLQGHTSVSGNLAGPGSAAAGVTNYGLLVMNDASRVSGNAGSGVMNMGQMVMNDTSRVTGNGRVIKASDGEFIRVFGGGVYNGRDFVMNGQSRISGNVGNYGGGGVHNDGTFVMNDQSRITRNRAAKTMGAPTASGGGVYNYRHFAMNDASSVTANRAQASGGGVLNAGGQVTMNGTSHISGNVARRQGGGIEGSGRLTMNGTSHIGANRAGLRGGGIFWYSYSGNEFTGVRCAPEVEANVAGSTPDDCYFEE